MELVTEMVMVTEMATVMDVTARMDYVEVDLVVIAEPVQQML